MGLFDLVTAPRVAELGKIKIGGKDEKVRQSQGGGTWRAPKKLDHFIITGLNRTAAGDLAPDTELMAALVARKFGDEDGKLRRLPIMVCSNDIEDIIQARYVWYAGRKVAARSDGKTVVWFGDPKTFKFLPEPREEPWREEYADLVNPKGVKIFKLHSVFNCMIAANVARWGGVYKFRTTSWYTANQLVGSLMHIHQLTGGVLRGLPMQLVIRPMTVEPEGKPTKIYVVHCELAGADLLSIRNSALELARSEAENSRQLRAAQIEYKRLLSPPGDNETEIEASEVVAEFHPENMEDGIDQPSPEDHNQDVGGYEDDGMIGTGDLLPADLTPHEPVKEAAPAGKKKAGKKKQPVHNSDDDGPGFDPSEA